MNTMKPNDPDIWNKKPVTNDEIVVPVQRMFPNCGKYPKGCLPKTGCKDVPNTVDSTLHVPTQTTYTLKVIRFHVKKGKED